MYQKAIAGAMMGTVDKNLAANLTALHSAVCSKMWCRCGAILDSRKAVLIEGEAGAVLSCGPCHDKLAHRLKPGAVVTDARLYNTDGTKKANQPTTAKLKRLKVKKTINLRMNPEVHDEEITSVEVSHYVEAYGLTHYLHGKRGAWTLTEYQTGLASARGKTQAECLALFNRRMGLGEKKVKGLIKKAIKEHGRVNKC